MKVSREQERTIQRLSRETGILPEKILADSIWLGIAQLRETYEPLKNIGQSARTLALQDAGEDEPPAPPEVPQEAPASEIAVRAEPEFPHDAGELEETGAFESNGSEP